MSFTGGDGASWNRIDIESYFGDGSVRPSVANPDGFTQEEWSAMLALPAPLDNPTEFDWLALNREFS